VTVVDLSDTSQTPPFAFAFAIISTFSILLPTLLARLWLLWTIIMALWTSSSQKEDDFFGDDDDDDPQQHDQPYCLDESNGMAARDAAAADAHHRTLGYHETFETSQQQTLQEGFAAGYQETFDIARNIGLLLGSEAASRLNVATSNKSSRRGITLEETTQPDDDDDKAFRRAVARTRQVLTSTTAKEPPTSEDHDDDDDDDNGTAIARTKPLTDLKLEVAQILARETSGEIG